MNSATEVYQYLKAFGENNLQSEPSKSAILVDIVKDASTNQANESSYRLYQQLTSQPAQTHHVSQPKKVFSQYGTLAEMKSVASPTRIGDIVFLPPDAELFIIGDIHGDLASVEQIINTIEESRAIDEGAFVVFLGDYVNNGIKNWQTLAKILSFQHNHPESVILLSGNHEFKESMPTALNEYFNKHWHRFTAEQLPERLRDRLPPTNQHYGHMRLELLRSFGFAEGERLYQASSQWGLRLPYICIAGNLMLSHSVGKREEPLDLLELLYGKERDAEIICELGYESWASQRLTLHSALVNNRDITSDLLSQFSSMFDVTHFVVGHCHYRSGDTIHLGSNRITTVVSSAPSSPDSGLYMYEQMVVTRARMRNQENLMDGDAQACYLRFNPIKENAPSLHIVSELYNNGCA